MSCTGIRKSRWSWSRRDGSIICLCLKKRWNLRHGIRLTLMRVSLRLKDTGANNPACLDIELEDRNQIMGGQIGIGVLNFPYGTKIPWMINLRIASHRCIQVLEVVQCVPVVPSLMSSARDFSAWRLTPFMGDTAIIPPHRCQRFISHPS